METIERTPNIFRSRCLICIILWTIIVIHASPSEWAENAEIKLYREYLRIATVQPNVDYKPAVAFLKQQALDLELPFTVHYPADENNPVVVITWQGSHPELPSIMLNSHMDVVPVYEEYWIHPPFAAEMDEHGDIYGRGAQDTKAVGMQYLAAIRALKQRGVDRLKRTIHVVYMPDEEAGGGHGMAEFIKTDAFKSMNVVFALDEGAPTLDENLLAFYVERTPWAIEFIFHGESGHGSLIIENTPGEALSYVVFKMMEFRKNELRKLKELNYPYGNVTTINLTMLKGGIETNVIPPELSASFDIRISASVDVDEFKDQVKRWCDEANGNVTIRNLDNGDLAREVPTRVDGSNPFWVAFKNGIEESGFNVQAQIMPASTDMSFIRRLNISAINFAPMMNTKMRVHGHNEYLNAATYLKGIDIYTHIIPRLANV